MQLTLGDGGLGGELPREGSIVQTLSKEEFMSKIKAEHEWKMNGLAIHLLNMPKRRRVGWLAEFEEKHGETLTDELKSMILQLHAARKSSDPDA